MLGIVPQAAVVKAAAQKAAGKYKKLDTSQKQAVNVVGVIMTLGTAMAAYKMFTGVSSAFRTITGQKWRTTRDQEEKKERNDLKQKISSTSEKPLLTNSQAKSIAFGLYEAFRNTQPEWSFNLWDEGTNEKAVYANLKRIRNRADWLLVSYYYGMPRRRTLAQELIYELNVKEQAKARSILSNAKVNI